MKTISKHVEDFVTSYPFTLRLLRKGIINYKAFARLIQPEIKEKIGEDVSVGSIAVALQRIHYKQKNIDQNLIGSLKGVEIISKLSCFLVSDFKSAAKTLKEIPSSTKHQNPFCCVINTPLQNLLIIESILEKENLFQKNEIGKKLDIKLAGLVVSRQKVEGGLMLAGISYPLLVLAENGIEVLATTANLEQEIIFVKDSDTEQSASILKKYLWR